jgi:hypothetical protein
MKLNDSVGKSFTLMDNSDTHSSLRFSILNMDEI